MNSMPHAMSRYTAVTKSVIEKCQQDYRAGLDLGQSIPGMSRLKAKIIVAESLEADSMTRLPAETLVQRAREGLESDWSLAVLAEIFFAAADDVKTGGDIFARQRQEQLEELAWSVLEKAIDSPTASPMLWYEEIYFQVGQHYLRQRDPKAIELMKRGLRHSLHFDQGSNADNFLRDLAEVHIKLDDLEGGLKILTGLLQHDPTNIWVYNLMAITFDGFGLADLGLRATQRGLELLQAKGDEHGLEKQLTGSLDDMRQSEKRGREADVDSNVLAEMHQALSLDFEAGRQEPIETLCQTLVPDLEQVPLKKAITEVSLPPLPQTATGTPVRQKNHNLGRNDPCWCGSGKKYKQCHLRSDQKR